MQRIKGLVVGFDLLNASVHLGFPTVMLTAHAFSVEGLKRSITMGASSVSSV